MNVADRAVRLEALRRYLAAAVAAADPGRRAGPEERGSATNGARTWGLEEVSQPTTSHVLRATNAAHERGACMVSRSDDDRSDNAEGRTTSGYNTAHDSRVTPGYTSRTADNSGCEDSTGNRHSCYTSATAAPQRSVYSGPAL